ncbi:MAG TPA: choice-of-anchor tandem repeat GloVer-containing protein [Candidatus Eisenbacteria bacterium]|nr:choice-of-anchor tandem repeat GloVer-containing protein [Candidatus Eisenbacteria bacterium]
MKCEDQPLCVCFSARLGLHAAGPNDGANTWQGAVFVPGVRRASRPTCCRQPQQPLRHDNKGGAYSNGCVFQLAPTKDGWVQSVIWNLNGYGADHVALIFDNAGNLYGAGDAGAYNAGAIFELSPQPNGQWIETILHSFGNWGDGWDVEGNLFFDKKGNLYGTTKSGGEKNGGTVFKLTPGASGWTETILYSFPGSIAGPDGDGPIGAVPDREGNLYGVTEAGGAQGYGAVFEITQNPGTGEYVETLIHNFNLLDGYQPGSALTIDSSGQLYGTTLAGGNTAACEAVGCGVVFKLAKDKAGNWNETILHEMTGSDGIFPLGPVVFDPKGNLYAVGQLGAIMGMGSVFMLTPTKSGPWTETVLHLFDFQFPNGKDGRSPYAGVFYKAGRIFGTTLGGGIYNAGIVFEGQAELQPDGLAASRQ